MRLQLGTVVRSEPEPGQLKKLRLLVTSLETALCAFRDGQRRTYDVLRKEELQLTEEIAAVEAASSEWAKEVPFDLDPSPAPPPPAPRRTRSASVGTVSRLTKGAPSSAAAPLQEPAADADASLTHPGSEAGERSARCGG